MVKLPIKSKVFLSTALVAIVGTTAAADPRWDGYYVGGSASSVFNLTGNYGGSGPFDNEFSGISGSVFAGYNLSFGALVAGGEVNAVLGSLIGDDPSGEDFAFHDLVDLKARAGTTFGNALVYATVGYSFGRSYSDFGYLPVGGINYGVGVDYFFSDKFFAGAEFLTRTVSDDGYLDARPLSSVSIRLGYKF